jgi:hypothetical protein
MYDHRLTKPQAIAAARWFIVDFHENLPDVDSVTMDVLLHQFVRELSALVQHDVDIDDVVDMLETLDSRRDLYWRTGDYLNLREGAARLVGLRISNIFTSDLNRMFVAYSPRAAHYFEAA